MPQANEAVSKQKFQTHMGNIVPGVNERYSKFLQQPTMTFLADSIFASAELRLSPSGRTTVSGSEAEFPHLPCL